MTPKSPHKILAEHSSEGLENRTEAAENLYLAAVAGGGPSHVRVKGTPSAGLSELLRQTYDRLFAQQRFVVPFYFALKREDRTAVKAADRFIYEFLLQSIAFRRNEPSLIAAAPDIREFRKLAPLPDAEWVTAMSEPIVQGDENTVIRSAFAAPFRAAAQGGFDVCVIADDLHNSATIDGGEIILDRLTSVVARSGSSIFLSSRRRFEIASASGKTFVIDRPIADEAAIITDRLAADAEIEMTASVRDLIVSAADRRPAYVGAIISAARDSRIGLTTYRDAARVYSGEVTNGRIARSVRSEIELHPGLAEELSTAVPTNAPFRTAALGERLGVSGDQLRQVVHRLAAAEIIEVSGAAATVSDDSILREILATDQAIVSGRITRTAAAANTAVRFLRVAPDLMSREYRRAAAAGLNELLSAFDGREITRAAIDYRTFRDRYKGLSDAEIRTQFASDAEVFSLPQILNAAALSEFAPTYSDQLEAERVVAGVGFAARSYRAEDEVVWIAAELDSKLEADPDLVREWIARLGKAAAIAGFERHHLWLVAPEGFSPGALELLAENNSIGSSRRQLTFLREVLRGEVSNGSAHEYEIVIPIGDETELIAVHAVEEIARRGSFPTRAINQVKTALVEACINAAEHSLSPDGKIYIKFALFEDRLTLIVSNRGLRLADKFREPSPESIDISTETRRGWGLSLMRTLMDEVRVEAVDDGTRIVMTKLRSIE